MSVSRRKFLKLGTAGSAGLMMTSSSFAGGFSPVNTFGGNVLLVESYQLLKDWCEGLLSLQINRPGMTGLHGGFLCPSCAMVHGRNADVIFPLLYMASKTGDIRYRDAALKAYDWAENTVSLPDGSWVNEISASEWRGTTVFGAIALAESLHYFPSLLDTTTRNRWIKRLREAGKYVYDAFTIDFGNINYPVTASYALSFLGDMLHEPAWKEKGGVLAQQSLEHLTPIDKLIYGEGHPKPERSAQGAYSVDLGYNVEESLPALVQYARVTKDEKIKQAVYGSLQAHLAFMLPDGGWDNSWGTRNYKWTWWGSRTSDGCQPAYALMADENPVFYKAALLNTRQLQRCTHNHLLYGGPHNYLHGEAPCVHHILGHSKAIATLLVHANDIKNVKDYTRLQLPREAAKGVSSIKDIATWLFSKGDWRGTVTANDQMYNIKGGHATGGALSLLWHNKTGPLIVAGMTRYQITESTNMQRDRSGSDTNLTPRVEVIINGQTYTNILDLAARVSFTETAEAIRFNTQSRLTTETGNVLQKEKPDTFFDYTITNNTVIIQLQYNGSTPDAVQYTLPIVCTKNERVEVRSSTSILIYKEKATVKVETTRPFRLTGDVKRIFHFVPGMEAVVLYFNDNEVRVTISVQIRDGL